MNLMSGGTYVLERLIGVGIYFFLTIVGYLLLRNAMTARSIKRVLNFVLIVLCIMAFFYIPAQSADLYRWRRIYSGWKDVELDKFFFMFLINQSTPASYLLFYLTAKLGIDGFLPAFSCFVYHGIVFGIIKSEASRNNYKGNTVSTLFLFFMSQGLFLGVISGIRNGLAFSILAYCVYHDLVLRKHRMIYYILAASSVLVHVSMVPLVALYYVISIVFGWKDSTAIARIVKITLIPILVVYSIFFSSDTMDIVSNKADYYLSGTAYTYVWEYVIAIISWIIMVLILIRYKRKYLDSTHYGIFAFSTLIFAGTIILIRSYSIFHRFTNFGMLAIMPILLRTINNLYDEGNDIPARNIRIISMLILLIACARGDLCGYKFLQF